MLPYFLVGLIIVVVAVFVFLYWKRCDDKNKCLDNNNKCINIPLGYTKQNNKCVLIPTTSAPVTTTGAPVTTTSAPIDTVSITTTPIPITVTQTQDYTENYKQLDMLNIIMSDKTILTLQNIKAYLPNTALEKLQMFAFIFLIIPPNLPDQYYNDLRTKLNEIVAFLVQIAGEELERRKTNNINIEETIDNSELNLLIFGSSIFEFPEERVVELLLNNDPDVNNHLKEMDATIMGITSININDQFIISSKQTLLTKLEKIKVLLQNKLNNTNTTQIEGFTVFENFAPF
jgi:hypothetical protein